MDASHFVVERRGDVRVVRVCGEVDLYTAPRFERALASSADGTDAVVVDLRDCRYIDSAGFGILVRYHRALGRRLSVAVDPHSRVRRVFRIAQLDGLLRSADGVDPESEQAFSY